jgi:hypothetical protein
MVSQLRLQVLLPVALLAVLGLGVGAFAMNGSNPATSDADAIAARIAARHKPTHTTPKPKPTDSHHHATPEPHHTAHLSPLQRALKKHAVAVVLFYRPGATYDAIQTREARAAALAANASFVAVNVTKNKDVARLAADYDVLEAPTVLVFRRGPRLKTRLEGYNDRTTIVQAVRNA